MLIMSDSLHLHMQLLSEEHNSVVRSTCNKAVLDRHTCHLSRMSRDTRGTLGHSIRAKCIFFWQNLLGNHNEAAFQAELKINVASAVGGSGATLPCTKVSSKIKMLTILGFWSASLTWMLADLERWRWWQLKTWRRQRRVRTRWWRWRRWWSSKSH